VGERKKTDSKDEAKQPGSGTLVRVRVAQVVWALFAIAALFLAVGALLIAVNANTHNALVRFVLDTANTLDLGVFSRRNGIKDFGAKEDVKNALLNWGLGAVAWLVLGRILERMLRP
jgi:hypothetical protein